MPNSVAVIGGGPAGLMAAETIAIAGQAVTIYDRMPTFGRKFLMAGRGGLNLTHSEDFESFMNRYGAAQNFLRPAVKAFSPEALCHWAEILGQPTFIGSSGRVFPKSMKASPLLRSWQQRLVLSGVKFCFQHRWLGWDDQENLNFQIPKGEITVSKPDAIVLALGGASWPRLGSDGYWVKILQAKGIEISPLVPANCGFVVPWSNHFSERFAGQPLKNITLHYAGISVKGEAMIAKHGLEGGAVYALAAALRDGIARDGAAEFTIDFLPHLTDSELTNRLAQPRGRNSLSNYLRKITGLAPVAISLLQEATNQTTPLVGRLKSSQLRTTSPFSIDRAISTAGGLRLVELTADYMIRRLPGIFACGEMLDWEAPTGGYLLQASFATAVAAGHGVCEFIRAAKS